MAIVVESTATASDSNTDTLVITKPTGLAEGDLMIAVLSGAEADGAGVGDWSLASGWTDCQSNTFGGALGLSIQYKVASSGDAAASNFTFTLDASTGQLHGSILRCSGAATDVATSDALASSSTYSATSANSATFAGAHGPFTPGADGALVIAQYGIEFATGSSARTFGSYTVTSGVTLNELFDSGTNDGSGGAYYSATYGVQATAAALSAYGATISVSSPDHYGQFAVFTPPVNASGSNTLASTTTTTFTQSGTADGVGSNDLTTATAAVFTQTGSGSVPTVWTVTTKS